MTLAGEVVGPYRLPRTLAVYAGGKAGTDNPEPNARTMARDAAMLANADVDFAPYDNDGNGFVDAFIVVHAGPGAEETGDENHIWSHKWVLTGGAVQRRRHEDLRLPDDSRGLQDRRLRARARASPLRLARPVRHRWIERRPRQLVPDGRRQLERRAATSRRIRRPGARRIRAGCRSSTARPTAS